MMSRWSVFLVAGCVTASIAHQAPAQWSAAQRLNDPAQNQGSIKEPAIYPAASGGFHAIYRYFAPGPVQMHYRRYQNGVLSPNKLIATGTLFGGDVCEAGNGDIHVVWEHWDDTPDIGWTKSSNGGITWTSPVEITNFTNVGKIPFVRPFGAANSPDVIMSCGKANGKSVWYNRYNGSSWIIGGGFGAATGVNYESEYEIFGMTRSLQDGSIYRVSDNSGNELIYQRYNGSTWTSTVVLPSGFYPRQWIAVNPSGQVMVTWDQDSSFWSRLFTPGVGFGPVIPVQMKEGSNGHVGYGAVTAIPGSNDFFAVYCKDNNRVRAKRWSNGAWGAEEIVSVNQTPEFTVNSRVAAGADGSIYAVWEYWGSGDAQAWYSVRPGAPAGPTGTLTGTVLDQYNQPVAGAAITTSGAFATTTNINGTYSMSMAAGTYTVAANKDFYTGQTINNVTINANQTTVRDFVLTAQAPPVMPVFSATASNSSVLLSYKTPLPGNYAGFVIRYRTDTFPTGPTDGTLLLDSNLAPDTNGSLPHNNLTNGTTYYYAAFTHNGHAVRTYSAAKTASGTPSGPADFDKDGDVDQVDYGHFQRCLTGATIPQNLVECAGARLDGDLDVDQADLIKFLGCMTAANVPADPNCLN